MQPSALPDRPTPIVSILTPAYNSGGYIGHTIESVLRQTFGGFELIVVDDGSTDDTAAVVNGFARRDSRVALISQSNAGIAAARNTAMSRARGRYFALLDSDDLWLPTYLEAQLAILNKRPDIGILSGNAINFGGIRDGEPILRIDPMHRLRPVSLLTLVQQEDAVSILSIFRREIADTIGGFDHHLRRSEDYDFWLRAAAAGFRIWVNPMPLGLYRRRPDSVSADEVQMLEAMRQPLLKVRRECGDRPEVQAAVDAQLARCGDRILVARARNALLVGDMTALATEFAALADRTGARKYRVARWLSGMAPATLRWAYTCRRTLMQLSRSRRRSPSGQRPRVTTAAVAPAVTAQDHGLE